MERAFLPKIQYDSKDFNEIVQVLSDYIKAGYSQYWNDFFESNEGQALIDLLAYIGDQLNFYLDKRVNNLYLDTVERRDSALKICNTLGYMPVGPIPANLDACSRYSPPGQFDLSEYPGDVFASGDSFYIQGAHWSGQVFLSGPTIIVGDLTFEVVDDVTILYADQVEAIQLPEETITCNIIRVALKEGISKYDQYVSESTGFQEFESSLEGIIQDSWQVCVSGVKPTDGTPGGSGAGDGWIQAFENSFVNHTPGSHVYVVNYKDNNKIKITFGDNDTFGAIPLGDITVAYRVGGGFSTNISAGVLDPDDNYISAVFNDVSAGSSSLVTIKLTNFGFYNSGDPSILYGGRTSNGADSESLDVIRIKAPSNQKTIGRAIAEGDTNYLASRFRYGDEQVAKVSVQKPTDPLVYGELISDPLGDYIDLSNNYVTGKYPLKFNGNAVSIYMPSFGLNVLQVFIWSLGTEGEPIESSSDMVLSLADYLNRGNFEGGQYLLDVGMTSVNYLVKKGEFADITVNLNSILIPAVGVTPKVYGIWYDPAFNKDSLDSSIREVVYELFKSYEPSMNFQVMNVWKEVSSIEGILKFGVQVASPRIVTPPQDPQDAQYSSDDVEVDYDQIARMYDPVVDIVFTLIPKV